MLYFMNSMLNAINLIITLPMLLLLSPAELQAAIFDLKKIKYAIYVELFFISSSLLPPLLRAYTLPSTGTLKAGPGAWSTRGRDTGRFRR